ncbi:MAG: hypothetical protein VKO39_12405 [Cyanobacteriota bacterium]|nr:hypothetical protein [Cyanobacteriota bacterium]
MVALTGARSIPSRSGVQEAITMGWTGLGLVSVTIPWKGCMAPPLAAEALASAAPCSPCPKLKRWAGWWCGGQATRQTTTTARQRQAAGLPRPGPIVSQSVGVHPRGRCQGHGASVPGTVAVAAGAG